MFLLLIVFFLGSSVVLVKSYSQDRTTFSLGDSSGYLRKNWKTPKFVDVYTNYADQKEVEKAYYENYNQRSKNRRSYSPDYLADRKDTLNFQIVDNLFSSTGRDSLESEYGHIHSNRFTDTGENRNNKKQTHFKDDYTYSYHTGKKYQPFEPQNIHKTENKDKYRPNKPLPDKDRNNFVYVQSQMSKPDTENFGSFYASSDLDLDDEKILRPNGGKMKFNSTGGTFMGLGEDLELTTRRYTVSYIQKIPSIKIRNTTTITPEFFDSSTNKYEEIDLTEKLLEKNVQKPDTKKRIDNLLKTYISNLFVEKYAHKNGDHKNEATTDGFLLKKIDFPDLNALNTSNLPKDTKSEQESKFLLTNTLWDLKNKTISKIKNLFGIFTIIKFNNTECNATNWAGTWQGFCYTSIECSQMNGTALGSCANGYGVCCAFRGSCGDSSNRNCTYFKSPNYPDFYPSNGGVVIPSTSTMTPGLLTPDPRIHWYYYNQGDGDLELDNIVEGRISTADPVSCSFSVYKANSNVRQMKIDFVDLDLASPTNGTCTNERLVITGQNTNDPIPVICGYNTGQHVYVDVSQLNGPLQIMVLSTTGVRKRFKLRICQYTDSCSTAQSNCLQYYTGVSGIIESFNYDQAAMFNRSTPGYFNNLNYAICIRREAGYCSVTFTNTRNGQVYPFQLVNRLPNGQLTVPIGQAGVDIINCPDDYIIIEGTRLCGDRFNDGSTVIPFNMNAPVTDTSAGPIVVNVRTNNNVTGLGFKLYYMQNLCTTT